ncbi:MAG TPA: hypothetical protein VLF67_05505 [Candidatus Saccharimonas sp.]|nr:hypothetical protein [Candidatus Saccharimonas sp.]
MKPSRRQIVIAICASLVLLVCGSVAAWYWHEQSLGPDTSFSGQGCQSKLVPSVIVVTYKPGTSAAQIEPILKSVGTITDNLSDIHTYVIKVKTGQEDTAIATLKTHPEISTATRDQTACPLSK